LLSGTLVGRGHPVAVYWIVVGVLAAGAGIMAFGVRETPLPAAPQVSWSRFVRSFWIDPRRYPDFGWMFATRALVMMGFYTLIAFLQFFLKDTLHLTPPQAAQTTGTLSAVTIAAGAGVALLAGWISDRIGRRGIISLSGIFLALTGAGLLFRPPLSALLWIAVLFGLGYGAFTSVDWALAIDVLPADGSPAKDLGIWAIANTLPQVLAPLAAGPVLDAFNRQSANLGYTVIFGAAIVYVVLGSILVWNIKGAR